MLPKEGAAIVAFKLVTLGTFDEDGVTQLLKAPGQRGDPACSGTRNLGDNLSDLRAQVRAFTEDQLIFGFEHLNSPPQVRQWFFVFCGQGSMLHCLPVGRTKVQENGIDGVPSCLLLQSSFFFSRRNGRNLVSL